MPLTDSQVVDLVIDAAYNEPENNPSRQRLAARSGHDEQDVRSVVNGDNWVRIRHIVLEELVRQRLRETEAARTPEPEPTQKPQGNGRRKAAS